MLLTWPLKKATYDRHSVIPAPRREFFFIGAFAGFRFSTSQGPVEDPDASEGEWQNNWKQY
jgi:hypothetical protein